MADAPVAFVTLNVAKSAVVEAAERVISHPGPVAEAVVVENMPMTYPATDPAGRLLADGRSPVIEQSIVTVVEAATVKVPAMSEQVPARMVFTTGAAEARPTWMPPPKPHAVSSWCPVTRVTPNDGAVVSALPPEREYATYPPAITSIATPKIASVLSEGMGGSGYITSASVRICTSTSFALPSVKVFFP